MSKILNPFKYMSIHYQILPQMMYFFIQNSQNW